MRAAVRAAAPPALPAAPAFLPPRAPAALSLLLAALLPLAPGLAGAADLDSLLAAIPAPRPARFAWTGSVAPGYDTYVQTFPLADQDTTETIAELDVVAAVEGRTTGRARHVWSLRPELSAGTELVRERLECGWQYRPDSVASVLRIDAALAGRQYRPRTDYALSSSSADGRIEGRWGISPRGRSMGELRLRAARLRYARQSSLELDSDDVGGLLAWRSGHDAERYFLLGARLEHRAYPDSAALDRTVAGLEGELDTGGLGGGGLRFYARSERRRIDDERARPSAWAHWGTLDWSVAAGPGRLVAALQTEVWHYDQETSAWFDSWRLAGALLYHGGQGPGGGLGPTWLAGVAGERLDAGADSPETYDQGGVRVGVESLGTAVSGTCTVEVGRRNYTLVPAPEPAITAAAASVEDLFRHSDFTYWELWLLGSWSITGRLSLDVVANYEPEKHTERTDDMSVAFASARLTWRW